ncbi:MAG: ABC transporter permease [Planctomycetota bacterium]
MLSYILRRLLLMIPTLFGITLITVGFMLAAPGKPGAEMEQVQTGGGGTKLQSSKALGKAMEEMGFFDEKGEKKWFWDAWYHWTFDKFMRLDLGTSIKYNRPVAELVWDRMKVTLLLNAISLFLIFLFSIPIGIYSSTHQGTVGDGAQSTLLFLMYSMPSWWLATMLILFLSSTIMPDLVAGLGWWPDAVDWPVLPSIGLGSEGSERLSLIPYLWDKAQHLVLPITALTVGGFAAISRYMRSGMLETIRQDYIRTARAKGVAEHDVLYTHALRNALIPIVTLAGGLLPGMIGGSIIIEMIFTIDGMGKLAFEAILNRDYLVVMANTTAAAILTLIGLLVTDLLYVFVDPRISLD